MPYTHIKRIREQIRVYNSLSNSLEPFIPQDNLNVSMYVCGPTVYNYAHIGNMRPVVVFDTLKRFLKAVGYKVTYVSNYTDVDDKIIKAAKEEGKSEKELTDYYIQQFEKTIESMGSRRPDIRPRVTEYMEKIIAYVDNLVKIGAAYVVDGDVYFRVEKIKDYGALSGINVEDLRVGARIEENTQKESPLDFALWKKTSEGIQWDSPWGKGRPGWHTECCVMIDTIFPKHYIDIHGGGYDLKFPHHENEIAQSEATHGNKIAKYWMHNAFINFGNEKMSKSLGNVVYAKDMIDKYGGAVTRLIILNAHYRQPVNFTEETVKEAQQIYSRILMAYNQARMLILRGNKYHSSARLVPEYMDLFLSALADDLNTANALTVVYDIVRHINFLVRFKRRKLYVLNSYFKTLKKMIGILGIPVRGPRGLFKGVRADIREYFNSRDRKDFGKSDELRKKLIEKGVM